MDLNHIEKAKELFLKYGGSHFQMAREGEYELYKSFNISKRQEYLWIQEHEKQLLKEFENENIVDSNFLKLCFAISEYDDIYYLEELIKLIKQKIDSSDSFSQMFMAEGLLGIVESFLKCRMKKHKVTLYAKKFALEILNSILEKPITIADYYKEPGRFFDPIDEEILIARIKENIEWWS